MIGRISSETGNLSPCLADGGLLLFSFFFFCCFPALVVVVIAFPVPYFFVAVSCRYTSIEFSLFER